MLTCFDVDPEQIGRDRTRRSSRRRQLRYIAHPVSSRVEADVDVQRFGFAGDANGKRLVFPHAHTRAIEGRTGSVGYGGGECTFEGLEGRLGMLRWETASASIGNAWLKDDGGRVNVEVERIELPHGIRLVRAAEGGVELLSPHVSMSEVRLMVKGPFGRPRTASAPPPEPTRRQERLRFLDSLSGRIYLTVKVVLDLPVLGVRTLDQQLRVPVQEGSLDYRALEESLNWLEGQFLDIRHDEAELRVQWKVPVVGSGHDLITWALDTDATTLAAFGRVPVRSLADFTIGSGPTNKTEENRKRKVLQAFTLDAIDIALSLLAPRHFEVGGGMILFGGVDQPGVVDLKVSGAIRDRGPGGLRGAIGSIDTTIKDLHFGRVEVSADRLHFDGLDQLEVTFDAFRPTAVTVVVHRVTATNLRLVV